MASLTHEQAAIWQPFFQIDDREDTSRVDRWGLILAARLRNPALLPVCGVGWNDWGNPGRVLNSLGRLGVQERWAEPAAAAFA
jgi:hypothetical protein